MYVELDFRWRSLTRRKLLDTVLSRHFGLVGSGSNLKPQKRDGWKARYSSALNLPRSACFWWLWEDGQPYAYTFSFSQPFFLERALHGKTAQCESYLSLYSCSKHALPVLKGKIWICYSFDSVLLDNMMKASLDLSCSIYKIFTKNPLSS